MTTMQERILAAKDVSKESRAAVRRRRDQALNAALRGEPVPRLRENELYVLRENGVSEHVPQEA